MRGELTINVRRTELLEALKENRDLHGAAFEKAKAGYVRVERRHLLEALDRLDRGEMINRILGNVPPENHTSDYDDAIDMMMWSTDDIVELTQQQFKQYVKDDWGWKNQWVTSNSMYLEA